MKKSTAYQPDLIESLRDPGEAEAYLNAALEENDRELFLMALKPAAGHSEFILAHNRSDQQRENPPGLEELDKLRKSFDALEAELRSSRKVAIKDREVRRKATTGETVGW